MISRGGYDWRIADSTAALKLARQMVGMTTLTDLSDVGIWYSPANVVVSGHDQHREDQAADREELQIG